MRDCTFVCIGSFDCVGHLVAADATSLTIVPLLLVRREGAVGSYCVDRTSFLTVFIHYSNQRPKS